MNDFLQPTMQGRAGDAAQDPATEGPDSRRLAAGAQVGPYVVETQIGAGGMGVVYRAHDTRLDRKVAIKVIHPHLAGPQLQAAFLREARLASSLNHPGIVTVYDILQHDDLTCIVMEFVQGAPLQRAIPEGGLAVDKAIAIASAIGEAVATAHAAGIVHRDLKPGNILLREDGQVKILDFGIAKAATAQGPDAKTEAPSLFEGSGLGTVGYMAPEQARGEQVDARADLYSFGVILYRMLTGRMPFQAANSLALLHAMMTSDAPSVRGAKADIPVSLEKVVHRALARNPGERYQTMRELLRELEGATSARAAQPEGWVERSIAVLPLINISPNPENEYICDGLAEELIDGLTQIGGLRVVSRSSSFQCKGTTPDVREIGRRLGASLLVHGSLRRSGDHLRLTVQLSQTAEGYQLWSHRFDAEVRDLFALQDELTAAVLDKLRHQLGARFPELKPAAQAPTAEAYDLYLQARYAFNRETPAGFKAARELFDRSAAADPGFTPALIGIAETHMRLDWYGLEPASESVPAVKRALATALELRPDSVAGLCNLAITQAGWDWDWAAAEETFQRALKAGGELAAIHFHYGLDLLTPQGRLDEALLHLRQAAELDPLSAIVNTAIGGCQYRMRRYGEAAETLQSLLSGVPDFGHAHWSLGRVLVELGQWDEAQRHFEEATKIMGQTPAALAEIGYCHARRGQRALAHCVIQELQRRAQSEWVSPLSEALVYAGLGEENAAMQRLEQALQKRIRQLVWVNVDPRYDGIRRNARFTQLITAIGLAPVA